MSQTTPATPTPRKVLLHRVEVLAYPTPDGQPFDWHQDLLQELIDGYYEPDEDYVAPAWAPDNLEEWIHQEVGSEYGHRQFANPERIGKYIPTDPAINVPVERRKHWLSASSAKKYAQGFMDWGCTVRLTKSKPIEWEQEA